MVTYWKAQLSEGFGVFGRSHDHNMYAAWVGLMDGNFVFDSSSVVGRSIKSRCARNGVADFILGIRNLHRSSVRLSHDKLSFLMCSLSLESSPATLQVHVHEIAGPVHI